MRDGVIAEFDAPEPLLATARRMRAQGYRRIEAYVPHAIPELDEALGIRRTFIPVLVLGAALSGVAAAYFVMWWCNAHDYPLNVGGRPLNSVPSNIPIMFETAVLFAALTAFVSMLLASRMPRLHDAMSEIEGFERTSLDRFWLVFEFPDAGWRTDLREELARSGAIAVRDVGDVP